VSNSRYEMFGELDALEAAQYGDKPATRAELQGLALMMGLAPLAHRVHAQVGRLAQVRDRVLTVGAMLDELREQGVIDDTQAGRFRELCLRTEALAKRQPDPNSKAVGAPAAFEFLWSDAFEDEIWERVRREARLAFTALRPEDDPWVG
jgi:hypothetical protein